MDGRQEVERMAKKLDKMVTKKKTVGSSARTRKVRSAPLIGQLADKLVANRTTSCQILTLEESLQSMFALGTLEAARSKKRAKVNRAG